MAGPAFPRQGFTPPPAQVGSPEWRYRTWRAHWRLAFADWLADGRPDQLVVELLPEVAIREVAL